MIHVGFLEDLQKKLTEDLEALLAGKNLVTEAAAKEKKKNHGTEAKSGVSFLCSKDF